MATARRGCAGAAKHRAAQAKYVGKNKAKVNAAAKAHYQKNKSKVLAAKKSKRKSGGAPKKGGKQGRPRKC